MSALLPQLDYATYSSQIFWLAITFFILYFSLSKVFLPNILDLMNRRRKYIEEIKEKVLNDQNTILKIQNDHALLISSKNEEVSNIIKKANQKASDIILENNIEIQQNIKALNDNMFANLNGLLDLEKKNLQVECDKTLELLSDKFGIAIGFEKADMIAGDFEKLWFTEFKKLKN